MYIPLRLRSGFNSDSEAKLGLAGKRHKLLLVFPHQHFKNPPYINATGVAMLRFVMPSCAFNKCSV